MLIDGAQSVAHIPVNVQQLGCDFFVFSGHKIFGPTGIGAVYIKEELHDILPPWQGGGNMIRNVTFEETTYADAPAKFEAGTPNIADAVGLGAALDYVNRLGLANIAAYEHSLLEYATAGAVSGQRLAADRHGPRKSRRAVVRAAESSHRRHRPAAGSRGHRGPRRSPLLATLAAALWRRNDGAAVAIHLQHDGRNRSPGRCVEADSALVAAVVICAACHPTTNDIKARVTNDL